jgi:hypothetical protein
MKYTVVLSANARRHIRYLLRQGLDPTSEITLENYAQVHGLILEAEAYRQEFPDDAPYAFPKDQAAK